MSIPSWLHLSQVSGSGDTIITITADTLDGAIQRVTDLLISGNTKSVTVPVTQLSHDYSQDYLTFNVESGGYITWSRVASGVTKTIEYRINGGSWTSIGSSTAGTRINVSAGDKVEVRGNNETYTYPRMSSQQTHYVYYLSGYFGGTASYSISGNIMSMFQSSGFSNRYTINQPHALDSMFLSCSGLTDAQNLVLPATALTEECYAQMFQNCYNMVHGPKQLPAETVPNGAYGVMFFKCSAMTETPAICATTVGKLACYGMFECCSSITESPILLPQTLSEDCYKEMFLGCPSLTAITCLATSIYGEPPYYTGYSTDEWADGVAATGVFTKSPDMNDWVVDSISGIPPGWTLRDYNGDWDIVATYVFASNGSHRILSSIEGCSVDSTMLVDGFEQPIATAITANAGVHTVAYKSVVDGVLFGGFFGNVTGLTQVRINNSITDLIDCWALAGPDTTGVTLSNNLKTINKYSPIGSFVTSSGLFAGSKIQGISLPSSLEYIGLYTFHNMNYLTGLTIPSGCILGNGALGAIFNANVSSVTHTSKFSITIPDDVIVNQTRTDQFRVRCDDNQAILNRFELVNHVYYAGPFALCVDDTTLTDYTVRDGTKFLGGSIFMTCNNVTGVTLPNSIESVQGLFLPTQTGITYTNGIWQSGSVMAFKATAITSTALTIPNTIKALDSVTNYVNSTVDRIDVPGSVKYLNRSVFSSFMPFTIVLGDGVQLAANAFSNNSNNNYGVRTATIPSSITYCDCNYDEAFIRKCDSQVYNDSVYFRSGSYWTSVTVPSGIKMIAPKAFDHTSANSLTYISIPNTVKEIGYSAFRGNSALTSVVIPDSVELYPGAIANCKQLSSITYSNNIKYLGESLGTNYAMSALTIPDGVKMVYGLTIGNGATALTTVNLGSGVKYVGKIGRQGSTDSYGYVNRINCYAPVQPKGDPFYVDSQQPSLASGGVLHYPSGADYSGWESLATSIGWTAVGDL